MNLIRVNFKPAYTKAPYLRPLISTLIIYIIFVYLLTLNPFRFSLVYFKQYIQFRRGLLAAIIGGSSIDDIILNLIMLFPLGIAIGSFLRVMEYKIKKSVIAATVLGFLISLSIEICQVFLSRSTSGIDIMTNTVGVYLGALLAYPVRGFDFQQFLNKLYVNGRLFYSRVILIYCVVAALILLIPVFVNNFSNWNKTYHLLIGNEATLNRPWKGVIYKLSIFNRKLKKKEITKLHTTNFHKETPFESSSGLLAEYIFTKPQLKKCGIFKDSIMLSPPLDSSCYLTEQSGIRLSGNSLISSQMPPTEFVCSLKKTNRLSIAIWLQPDNLEQDGPARIVSLSKDPDHRNFTLGQSGSRLNFRVRTPLTGLNGSNVELLTPPILTTDKPQFVVATFHRGESKLFCNGKITSSILYDTSYYLPLLLGLSKYHFGRIAFCFMLLFPLGWLARGLVTSKVWKSVISSLIVIVPFLISSLINTLYLHHCYDFQLFFICCFISILLLIIGFVYEFLSA